MGELVRCILNLVTVEIAVIITATLPVIELRVAIPIGIALGLAPLNAAVLSFIGSMMQVPFIMFAIIPIFNGLRKTKLMNKLIRKIV